MKCPNCETELQTAVRHGIGVDACPACKGMWFSAQELERLEDEAFDLGDDEKGTLVFAAEPSPRLCPECAKPLQGFQYRLYDLPLEFCAEGHGFFLDAGEDDRVLALMRDEEKRVKRSDKAEQRWTRELRRLRAPGFFEKLRSLLG